jgi:hypothetical protein
LLIHRSSPVLIGDLKIGLRGIFLPQADYNAAVQHSNTPLLGVERHGTEIFRLRNGNDSGFLGFLHRNREPVVEVVEPEPADTAKVEPDTAIVVPVIPEPEVWVPKLYLKTNAVGLGMAIANAGVEVDLARHWSVGLHTYYSAWNYFKSTIKFRTFAVQPEVRYWFSDENDGFFAGAHLGLLYYNFAFDGDYRYQDHDGTSPALGGGLSIGYRLPISKNNRWRVEFAVGAGVYDLNYDIFHNTPDVKDGLMTEESIKKTYWGIDQAAITFSYSFDLKKKGGKQ